MNVIRVTGTPEIARELSGRSEVARLEATRTYSIPEPTPATLEQQIQATEWGLNDIGADDVWSTFGVRGMDRRRKRRHRRAAEPPGARRKVPRQPRRRHIHNWFDPSNVCGNPSNVPCDNNNHGTHTIGTMVGDDGGSNQIGVAPGARWIAAKGCESNSCSDSGLLESAEFMLAPTDLSGQNPRPDLRPNIVNNSWGGGGGDSWFQAAVGAWRRRDSSQRLWQVQPWRNSRTRSRATPATRLPSFEPG